MLCRLCCSEFFMLFVLIVICGSKTQDDVDLTNESDASGSSRHSGSSTNSNSKSEYSSKTGDNDNTDQPKILNKEQSKEYPARKVSRTEHTDNDLPTWGHVAEIHELTNKCVQCICEATGGCTSYQQIRLSSDPSQITDRQESGVGPLSITRPYWEDAGRPTVVGKDSSSFYDCANDMTCASQTVKAYMAKYPFDCNADGIVNCTDYAAIHNRGPFACQNPLPPSYKERFLNCWIGPTSTGNEEKESWFPWFWRWRATTSKSSTVSYTNRNYFNTEITSEQTLLRNQSEENVETTTELFVTSTSQITTAEHTPLNNQTEEPTDQIKPSVIRTHSDGSINSYTEEPVTESVEVNATTSNTDNNDITKNLDIATTVQSVKYTEVTPEVTTEHVTEPNKENEGSLESSQAADLSKAVVEETNENATNVESTTENQENQPDLNESPQPTTESYVTTVAQTENAISSTDIPPETDQLKESEQQLTTYSENFSMITASPRNEELPTDYTLSATSSPAVKGNNYSFTVYRTTRKISNPLHVFKITDECIHCICEAASDCMMKAPENSSFGPFRITKKYWKDAGNPPIAVHNSTASFINCANNYECSGDTVRAYMNKYQFDCNGDGIVNCSDYMAIHNNGPYSCREPLPLDYLSRYLKCSSYIQESTTEKVYTTTVIKRIEKKESALKKWFSNVWQNLGT